MTEVELDRLETLDEMLALVFYFLMFVALVAALSGSIGRGFLVLILGSGAHVVRAAFGEFVERERSTRTRVRLDG